MAETDPRSLGPGNMPGIPVLTLPGSGPIIPISYEVVLYYRLYNIL